MAWTTPRTWVAGELVTALMMNQNVRDNANALRSEHFTVQQFRGLHLSTSPDEDLALTTVALIHADEIVADDGTRFLNVNNLAADITVAGAAGLDAGSEVASTWYGIYFVAKDDGTKSLTLHREKDYFLDEVQATDDQSRELREGATTNVRIAQTFDVDVAGKLELFDLKLQKQGAPTGRMWLELYATSAGAPTGSVLATSDKMDVSRVSTTAHIIRFIFRMPVTLAAGTTYAVAIAGDYTASATVNIIVRENTAGGYGAGTVYTHNGTSWASDTEDLWFQAWITENETAVVLPSGYTKKALLGYVFNDSGGNLAAFVAVGRKVYGGGDITTSFTSTVYTLTSLVAFVPPVPVRLHLLAGHNTAQENIQAGSVRNIGGAAVAVSNPIANINVTSATPPPLPVEYQAFYLRVSAGTGRIYQAGWEW